MMITVRARQRESTSARRCRDDRGEALAIVVVWPVLLVATVVLAAHALIVTNARSGAEVAASEGLRAAWQQSGIAHPAGDRGFLMGRAAEDAAARAAGQGAGWRWWQPGSAEVRSDWCAAPGEQPEPSRPGWVRVLVTGEVIGPLAALWPDRLDRVYATAEGPAVLTGRPDPAASPGSQPAAASPLVVC